MRESTGERGVLQERRGLRARPATKLAQNALSFRRSVERFASTQPCPSRSLRTARRVTKRPKQELANCKTWDEIHKPGRQQGRIKREQ